MSDDEIEDDELDIDDAGFDDFDEQPKTLGDLWRENPLVKIGIIVSGVIVIFGIIFIFSGPEERIDQSYVPAGEDVKAPPGQESSPNYIEAVKEENQARVEQAFQTGTSALPTPIDPPVGRIETTDDEKGGEDPLERWKKLQEERLQRELEKAQTIQPEPALDTQRAEAVQALAGLLSEQMSAILESKSKGIPIQSRNITSPNFLDQIEEEKNADQEDEQEDIPEITETVIASAGEIYYAQLLTEANSDIPGPILAQIVSGPLAGNRILGSFDVQDELLTLNFSTVVIDGIATGIDAIALDPDTTLPGLATEVDHRYLQRIVLPMAAAFVEGAADAIANTGLTTVTIEGETVSESSQDADNEQEIASGVEEAGQELRSILDEMISDIEVLVRIEAGTPFGILFLQSLTETDTAQ